VRPSDIVIQAPRLNRLLRIRQAHEPALVETLVAEPAIEALGEGVLNRLARLNEPERAAARVRPLIERFAGELRSVVANDRLRVAAFARHRVEHAHDALAG
jgi:hypothetical protein